MNIIKHPAKISKLYIIKLSLPIFFSNLAIPMVGIVDTGLMGHLSDQKFLAAVSISTAVITMIYWSFGFLRMGTVGLVAQALGRGDYREIVLTTIDTPNALFGEMALIDGAPRSAGAIAATDASVTEVSHSDFLGYVQQNPAAAMNIMKNLSKELRTANMISAAAMQGDTEDQDSNIIEGSENQTPEDIDDTDAIYETPASKPILYTSITLLILFFSAVIFTVVCGNTFTGLELIFVTTGGIAVNALSPCK
mgnify:CR=1 FL=1